MTIIRRPSPRRDLGTVRDVFDRFFEEAAFRPWASFAESRLPLDISSSEDAITIEAALPGRASRATSRSPSTRRT